jgi:hypothetical protein
VGGPVSSTVWTFWRRKKFLAHDGICSTDPLALSLITTVATLSDKNLVFYLNNNSARSHSFQAVIKVLATSQ